MLNHWIVHWGLLAAFWPNALWVGISRVFNKYPGRGIESRENGCGNGPATVHRCWSSSRVGDTWGEIPHILQPLHFCLLYRYTVYWKYMLSILILILYMHAWVLQFIFIVYYMLASGLCRQWSWHVSNSEPLLPQQGLVRLFLLKVLVPWSLTVLLDRKMRLFQLLRLRIIYGMPINNEIRMTPKTMLWIVYIYYNMASAAPC